MDFGRMADTTTPVGVTIKTKLRRHSLLSYISANKMLYVILLPGFLYLFIFNYVPMYGVLIAFKDFSLVKGIIASPWIGFQNFKDLFGSIHFYKVLRNSLVISGLRLICSFPFPIILALFLNEVHFSPFKRTVQTIIYIPHFISWVVIVGIVVNFLSFEGLVNHVIQSLGGKRINLLIEPRFFWGIIVVSEIWKAAGWGTITRLAAMSEIDPELYEAAIFDGANLMQRVRRITLPCITGTIIVVLILRIGRILNNGFERIFLLGEIVISGSQMGGVGEVEQIEGVPTQNLKHAVIVTGIMIGAVKG